MGLSARPPRIPWSMNDRSARVACGNPSARPKIAWGVSIGRFSRTWVATSSGSPSLTSMVAASRLTESCHEPDQRSPPNKESGPSPAALEPVDPVHASRKDGHLPDIHPGDLNDLARVSALSEVHVSTVGYPGQTA